MDVKTYQYSGKQELVYTNNSNDTLYKVYYHLFNNAFQPGSEMDMRLQSIKDPDGRMFTKLKESDEKKQSRIANLQPDEIAYMGDDIPDIPVLHVAGLSACPQDAVSDVKANVHYQSPFLGGKTCVRDLIEQTLRCQNKWLSELAYEW